MTTTSLEDFKVGDRVYCLAWVGTSFEVVDRTDRMLSLQAPADSIPYGQQVDIFADTAWMVTHEPWDQIWHWPDRAGERYEEVVERFLASHRVGDVVAGYYFEGALDGFTVRTDDRHAMAFRIRSMDPSAGRILVHPVAAANDDGRSLVTSPAPEIADEHWLRCGPTVPLRLEMRMYRWCLSYGEMVLNWRDLTDDVSQPV